MKMHTNVRTSFSVVAVLCAGIACAQQQTDFSKVEIKTTKLAENFYTLEGQGGTISVLTGPDGVLLVGSQFAPLTEKLIAAIKKISDKQGGSLAGILEALSTTIGRSGPNTKIIPGHGAISDRNGLIGQRDLILAVRDKVAALIAQSKTLEEVIAAKPTAQFDARVPGSTQQSVERFIKWLYAEINAAH